MGAPNCCRRRKRLEPGYWLAARYVAGCPVPPILTDVPRGLERHSFSSLHWNVFSHSIGLSNQRSHFQKGFGAALQGGDDHIFLPTSCTFGCDGCCPGRCTRTEPWPSRANSINGGSSLKPAYPLSLGIRDGLERTGVGRVERWWTGDGSTGRGCARHQRQRDSLSAWTCHLWT